MGRKQSLVAESPVGQAVKQGLFPGEWRHRKDFKYGNDKVGRFCFRKLPLVAGLGDWKQGQGWTRLGLEWWNSV